MTGTKKNSRVKKEGHTFITVQVPDTVMLDITTQNAKDKLGMTENKPTKEDTVVKLISLGLEAAKK